MKKVKYACPRCTADLESPIENAGQQFPCPTCGHTLTVPGVEKLNRIRAEERKRADDATFRAAQKAAAEKERVDREAAALGAREKQAREAEHLRAEGRRRRAESPRNPIVWAAVGGSGVVALLFVLFYIATVRPLQNELMATQNELSKTEADLKAVTEALNHNVEVANHNTEALRALAKVAKGTAADLDALAQTVSHNASAANRTSGALAHDLDSLTETVNYNARAANANR